MPSLCVHVIRSALTEARTPHIEKLIRDISEVEGLEVVSVNRVADGDSTAVTKKVVDEDVKIEKLTDPRLESFNKFAKTLDPRNVSNALKHLAALKAASESAHDGSVMHLVLEDDVLAGAQWSEALLSCLRNLPSGCDVVALGIPGNSEAQFQLAGNLYDVLPCCDSYLITKEAAAKLARAFKPIRFITNVHLSYLARSLKLAVYLHKPNVFLDGSKYGAFISTLTPGNQLILNRAYIEGKNALADPENKLDEGVRKALFDNPHSLHPDFKHLQAMYEWKKSGAAAAEPLFEDALASYDANNALVTNESPFLRDYIRLHAFIQ
nr:hypothetical protein TetV2_00403 [Oceanusvirus sp.]